MGRSLVSQVWAGGLRVQCLCVSVGSQVLVSIVCRGRGSSVRASAYGVPGCGGGSPGLAGSPGPGPPRARRRPRDLTCLTCLPQLAGRARSPAPDVGLTRFLATEPELPSHLDFRGEGQGSGIGTLSFGERMGAGGGGPREAGPRRRRRRRPGTRGREARRGPGAAGVRAAAGGGMRARRGWGRPAPRCCPGRPAAGAAGGAGAGA